MICDHCKRDRIVTTTWCWSITRIDARGRETVEHHSKTLCRACGQGEQS
jgi:hypothetical protein